MGLVKTDLPVRELIFATNNRHKVDEIKAVLNEEFRVYTLQDAGIITDIPEPFDTLEENAFAKSLFIYKQTGKMCFSEDTGLEVAALNNEPGVRSARYAGEPSDSAKNIALLLERMSMMKDRTARFRTVISLIIDKVEYQFEGICAGTINEMISGTSGFGYDPVFVPEGDTRTFAEMTLEEKNRFSHRRKAVDKMIAFLNSYATTES